MARGDHLYVQRGRHYTHHGIDCGDGTVIHHVGPRGPMRHLGRTSMASFAAGATVQVRAHVPRLDPETTVRHAESRVGSRDYHLVRNNCEHFATWCCTGRAASSQVRRWMLAAQGTLASMVAVWALGAHLAVLGTVGAGLYAFAGPLRHRTRPPG
jgi:hypothetical protein